MQHKPKWHMKANRHKTQITATPHAWAWCEVLWESIKASNVPVMVLKVVETLSVVCRRLFLVVKLKAVCCKTHDLENYLPQNLSFYFIFHILYILISIFYKSDSSSVLFLNLLSYPSPLSLIFLIKDILLVLSPSVMSKCS